MLLVFLDGQEVSNWQDASRARVGPGNRPAPASHGKFSAVSTVFPAISYRISECEEESWMPQQNVVIA